MNRRLLILMAPIVMSLGACASHSSLQSEFGTSVRLVSARQTHDAVAALYPTPGAIEGSDGYLLENVINEYRNGVSSANQVDQPLSANVIGAGGNR